MSGMFASNRASDRSTPSAQGQADQEPLNTSSIPSTIDRGALRKQVATSPAPAAMSLEERKEFFTRQTETALHAILNRESSTIAASNESQLNSGAFGALNRMVTGSNPYALERQGAEQRLHFAERELGKIAESREAQGKGAVEIEILNQARRAAGLKPLDSKSWLPVADAARSTGALNQGMSDRSAYRTEQEALSVTRDAVITLATAAIPVGGVARAGVQVLAKGIGGTATLGGVIAGGEATVKAIDDVQSGRRTATGAATDVGIATAAGLVVGVAGEAGIAVAGKAMSAARGGLSGASGETAALTMEATDRVAAKAAKLAEKLGPRVDSLISDPKTQFVLEFNENGHVSAYFFNAEGQAQKFDGSPFISLHAQVERVWKGESRQGISQLKAVEQCDKGVQYVVSATEDVIEKVRAFAQQRHKGFSWGCSTEGARVMQVAGVDGVTAPSSVLVPKTITGLHKEVAAICAKEPGRMSQYHTSEKSLEDLVKTMGRTEKTVAAIPPGALVYGGGCWFVIKSLLDLFNDSTTTGVTTDTKP